MSNDLCHSLPLEKLAKPLVECAAAGNAEAFKALLEAGADAGADYKEYKGCTLLHTAVRGGSVDVVSAVLDAGADVNETDSSSARSPLCEALEGSGNEEVARRLVLAGADVNFTNPSSKRSPLSRAVSNGFERLAEDLLLKGADLNRADGKVEGRPLLACAASGGRAGMVSTLLRHGADKDEVDGRGDSPLILASKEGHLSTVKILLEAGADISHVGEDASALGVAAEHGHIDVMEAILSAGAEVNAEFGDGTTALHYAAMNTEPDAVDILVKAGAKMEIKGTEDNLTPLLMAATQEAFETMCALLRHGADPNAKAAGGDTALHMICTLSKAGFEKVANELMLRGADKTILDWDGCTPAGNLDVPDLFGIPDEQEFASEEEIERVRVLLQTRGPAGKRCRF